LPGRWNPENGRSNGKFTWTKTGCKKILKCAGLELESQNNKWLVEKCRSKLEDPGNLFHSSVGVLFRFQLPKLPSRRITPWTPWFYFGKRL
jgi:hypothetical protein